MKFPYQEGDWILVPLDETGSLAVGRIARAKKRGAIILGYFFGPKRTTIPTLDDLRDIDPRGAVLIRLVGDLGLIEGVWTVLGGHEHWPDERVRWPMPAFGFKHPISEFSLRREYDDDDPNELYLREIRISDEERERLPEDGLSGYVALEIRLRRLLT